MIPARHAPRAKRRVVERDFIASLGVARAVRQRLRVANEAIAQLDRGRRHRTILNGPRVGAGDRDGCSSLARRRRVDSIQ
ncbi:MAG: hypothetical protein U0610_16675 [bacterium]